MPRKAKATAPNCMTSKCTRKQITRGLCGNCYHTALNLVTRGETTWDELQELKMIREKKVKNPFLLICNSRRPNEKSVSIPMKKKVGSS